VAAPAAWWLADTWCERGMLWLGLSGGAVLLERGTTRELTAPPPAAWQREPVPDEPRRNADEEANDVLLR